MLNATRSILEGQEIREVLTEGEFAEFVVGADEKDSMADAKAVCVKFFKDKHYLDGLVKGYHVEPIDKGYKVTIQFVPGVTFESWLADQIISGMANQFGWTGNKLSSYDNRQGDQMVIKCRGEVR